MTQVQHQLKVVNILHGIQFVLGAAVLGIGLYLMFFASPRPQGNSGRWALSVAAKSLVIIAYQVLTMNVKSLQRWSSAKAYLILDVVEVVFWIAATVLTVIGMVKVCTGVTCILSGVVVGLAVLLALLGLPVLWFAYKHWSTPQTTAKGDLEKVKEASDAVEVSTGQSP